jgi:CubicO group peptidase (beta-lactamase class C family)
LQTDTDLHRWLDERIARHRADSRAPSVALAIESIDGSFRWSSGAGPASTDDPTTMSAQSPYFAASITKLLVAVLVLQLRREGLLDLDTTLVSVVPHDLRGLHVRDGVDRTAELTIGQALAHTTGLPNYLEDAPRRRPSLLDEALVADRGWGLEEVLERSRVLGPRFAPDAPRRAHYSDTNYQLVGAAIEHVTGRPLDAVLRQHIVEPLGLTATRLFDPAHDDVDTIATLYHRSRPLRRPLLLGSVGADGGLVTTAAEGVAFLRAWVTGALVPTDVVAEMQAEWRRIFLPFRYGLGVMRFGLPRLLTGMTPLTMVGHSGASGALAFHLPEPGLLVSGTVNQLEPRRESFELALGLLRRVVTELR